MRCLLVFFLGFCFSSCSEGPSSANFNKVLGYSCTGAEFQKAHSKVARIGIVKKFYLDRELGKKNLTRFLLSVTPFTLQNYDGELTMSGAYAAELMKRDATLFSTSDMSEKSVLSNNADDITGSFTVEHERVGRFRLLYKYNKQKKVIVALYIAAKNSEKFADALEVFSEATLPDCAVEVIPQGRYEPNRYKVNGVECDEAKAQKLIETAFKEKNNIVFIPLDFKRQRLCSLAGKLDIPFDVFTVEKTARIELSKFDPAKKTIEIYLEGGNFVIEGVNCYKFSALSKDLLVKLQNSNINIMYPGAGWENFINFFVEMKKYKINYYKQGFFQAQAMEEPPPVEE